MQRNWSRILRQWLSRRGRTERRSVPQRRSLPTVRPHLENLEDRTLLSGQSLTVNVLGDSGGAAGVQSGAKSGDLRWCINQADLPANSGSTITFDSTVFDPTKTITIQLQNGELPISDNMTITGPGVRALTVSGTDGKGGASRVFDITSIKATVSISDMTIANGNAAVYYTSIAGNQGGDIFNGGNLTLKNDIVTNGFSSGNVGGPNGRGGAIFNAEGQMGNPGASLILDNTVVENSEAFGTGALGGGVYSDVGATLTLQNGSVIQNNQSVGQFIGSVAAGAGLYNKGTLNIKGTATKEILIQDNIARGGPFNGGPPGGDGGPAYGGGVYNSGAFSVQYAQFLGNRAIGGNGIDGFQPGGTLGTPGGPGGNGGNAQGGGIYNGVGALVLSVATSQFGVDGNGVGNEALGGSGGKGGNGAPGKNAAVGVPGGDGGIGGNGGYAEGGAVANLGGNLSFTDTTLTDSEAVGGNGGNSGNGGHGGNSTNSGVPGAKGGDSLAAGKAGKAVGGAVFNSQSNLSFSNSVLMGSRAIAGHGGAGGTGGTAGAGGNAGSKTPGGTGGPGGFGGAGGAGGAALGGGFYNLIGTVTITGTSFTADSAGIGNEALSGAGGAGGIGGNGGQGGDQSNTEPPGSGGPGGVGGAGNVSGAAEGGDGSYQGSGSQGGTINLTSDIFTSSLVQSANGGAGGNGGNGGSTGNTGPIGPPAIVPAFVPHGGAGGNAGIGGDAGHASGGTIAVTAAILNDTGGTFGGSGTLGNQVIGGAGGAGGIGGTIGPVDHGPANYVVATPEGKVNPAGNGGAGGAGAPVNGGAISVTSTPLTSVNLLSNYQALNFSQSGGYVPPDTTGAAGPTNVVETVNQAVAIYTPKGTGATSVTDSLDDFWFTQGGLAHADATSRLSDPAVVWDEQIQRFIIGDQDVDFGTHVSTFDIAVSKSASPATLTGADWNFFQVSTTEAGFDADYPGNMGWNHDALVFTLNMFPVLAPNGHVQVVSVDINALVNGTALTPGANAFSNDYAGFSVRPTVMHDSKAGDPMWLVEEGGNGDSINVVSMSNVLSGTPTFTTSNISVLPYSPAVSPLQPDGTRITSNIDSRIMKVAEQNGLLVAAHTVSDTNGDEDNVQWYVIDVSSGTPTLQQEGDVTGGPGVYDMYPGIDINPQGAIGMSFMQSTTAGQFLSMYITGRTPNNPQGTMQIPVLVQAGQANYHDFSFFGRAGDLSGINVDSDGSFWAINEFADTEPGANWATEVAHFTVNTPVPPVQTVSISNATFDNNSIFSGAGGAGGQAGLFSLDGANQGFSGLGGNGGLAQGGTISMSSGTSQNATFDKDTIEDSTATAGVGGAGAVNYLGAAFEFIQNWNGFGSNGGAGGSVQGVGVSDVNYNLDATNTTIDNGIGVAGAGGAGGGASVVVPRSWQGGAGGAGGSVQGGGIYLSNTLKTSTPLTFSFSDGSVSHNKMTAGAGGTGGNAGASGSKSIAGGAGGAGGLALGGGLYVFAGSQSVNAASLANDSLLGDQITAGEGGVGGAGYNAPGGAGGAAQGGGIFNTSLNTTSGQGSSFTITDTTLAGDQASGGDGGNAGSATTPNGGAGGAGGNAGAADGAGMFNGPNTTLTITNTTFGGASNSANANANANVLTSGLGGRGGNAGTPAGVINNNGGPGGAGGVIAGGDIYNAGSASLINDTVVWGQAAVTGLGGAGGSGAGNGGKPGAVGTNGTANAGGYFAATGSSNTIGNTILALNTAVTNSDVAGSFTSAGNNVLTSVGSATGFDTGSGGNDLMVTPAQVDLGPLLNNGGPTLTDAVLPNSAAVGTGNINLVPNGLTTDQRGPGFARINTVNNTVDVGAFEFNPPIITSLSPSSVIEGSSDLMLTVTGNNFAAGATVSFGGTSLGPITSSSTQLTVVVPARLLTTPGQVDVTVNEPDGSGVQGETVASSPILFTIAPTPFTLNNPGTQQNFVGETVSLTITPAAGFTASSFTATGLPKDLKIDANTGVISGTLASTAQGTYSVTVTATDSQGDQANVTFSWIVGPPLQLKNPGDQSNDEGDAVALLITAQNGFVPSGYIVSGLPAGLSINQSTGLISGTIDPRAEGTYTVTVTPANNGGQGSVTFQWVVTDTTPPTLTNPGTQTSKAGQTINLAIKAVDADAGTFTATGLPQGLSINSQGAITGTIAANTQGTYAVTVMASDGTATSAPMSFLWVVSGSVSPPPPPGGTPPGSNLPTFTSIVNVSNQYQGVLQLETVTVDVTNSSGIAVNEGVVAIQVDGQTVFAPVVNGVAKATVATSLLDFGLWMDLLFNHPLATNYSDSSNVFAPSGTSMTLPPIWLDFLFFQLTEQFQTLTLL